MRLVHISVVALISIYSSRAAKLPTLINEFLSIPDKKGDWNEQSAKIYLDHLIEKHGAQVQEQLSQVTEEDKTAFLQSTKSKPLENDKKWHIGDATLTKLDKNIISSVLGKMKDGLSSWTSKDDTSLQDYGMYFFSISDTNIFEGLET